MTFIDLSGFSFFIPLLTFLVVFLIGFAVLQKAKIFEGSKFWQLFVSLLIAIIFVTASGPTLYVSTIIPWFAVFIVAFVLVLALLGFANVGKEWTGGIAKAFVVGLLVIFIISGIFVFSAYISPYLPWNSGYGGNPDVLSVTSWFYQPRIYGALLLLVVAGLVSWFLAKSK